MVNGRIMCNQVVLLLVHSVLLLYLTVTETYASICNITPDVTQLLTDISSCYNNTKTVILLNYGIYSFHISPANTNAVNTGTLSLENLI